MQEKNIIVILFDNFYYMSHYDIMYDTFIN